MSKSQYELNRQIEALIDKKEMTGEAWTGAEIKRLKKYQGDGGHITQGASGTGILYEFYTPEWLTEIMWKVAGEYGFEQSGNVLEPACGTGNFLVHAPKPQNVTCFETNRYSAKITQIRFPAATVYQGHFEKAFLQPDRFANPMPKSEVSWLKGYPFSLVIGNPPYGKNQTQYSGLLPKPKMPTLEMMFIYQGLKLLKPGGLLVMLVPQAIMRTGVAYNKVKEETGKIGTLIDAFRLPKIFSNTEVPTDIIVLKRK